MNNYFLYIVVFLSTLIMTLLIESAIINPLSRMAKQPIYNEGPSWHCNKSGTPTMGGIAFVVAICLSLLITGLIMILVYGKISHIELVIVSLFALGNSLIGIVDDLTKIRRKHNSGLTPMQKIIFQSILSVLFLMARKRFLGDTTILTLPFFRLDLGVFYYIFCLIVLLGIINCANLTDGIDGLASSVAIAIATAFLMIGVSSSLEVGIISSALLGGALAFLVFNANPAKIFMGDTGSLFLGAIIVAMAFSAKNPAIIIPIGIVYVLEGISVILQVICYKLTKKRLFKMAPIHHHFEKCGIRENTICVIAVIITLVCSSVAGLFFRG